VCLQPDVLLLDEVLAVGDQAFRDRCLARLREYHASGGTLILVSHEMDQIRELCSRAVWLEHGVMRMDGEVGAVLAAYSANDSLNPSRGLR
jgi:ABC-type polysaccharide/polyol phosphate transport system ATPase subunit